MLLKNGYDAPNIDNVVEVRPYFNLIMQKNFEHIIKEKYVLVSFLTY